MTINKMMLGFAHSVVIDDLLEDPVAVRDQVLALPRWFRGDDANYPGYTAALPSEIQAMLRARIEQAIGYRTRPFHDPHEDLSARVSKRGEERMARSFVHCDPYPFTAILYLTPPRYIPAGIPYGTRVYQSKEHGANTVLYPRLHERLRRRWTEEQFESIADECRAQTFNLLYWDLLDDVEFRFNRLCIINGKHFHSASPCYYGETREQGRLTLNYFFELDPDAGSAG